MDRERCLSLLKKAYGIGLEERGLEYKEMQELLEAYVLDNGHEDKIQYIPQFIQHPLIERVLRIIFDYYIRKYQIYSIEYPNPNSPTFSTNIILFY